MIAYTDASLGNGFSIHSYSLIEKEQVILQDCFVKKSKSHDVDEAELISVISFLEKCHIKKLSHITINTDNLYVARTKKSKKHGELIKYMRQLLKDTESQIVWISRKLNKLAHNVCKSVRWKLNFMSEHSEDIGINPIEYVVVKEERKYWAKFKKGSLNADIISEEQKSHLKTYYNSLIKEDSRKTIEEILNYAHGRSCSSTRRGRQFFIEKFIEKFHPVSDIEFENARHIFNRVTIDNIAELEKIELNYKKGE